MSRKAIYDRSDKISLNLARLRKGGQEFEVVVDADKAVEFKQGKNVTIRDVLKSEHVFSDAKKGLRASETAMQQIFETDDELAVAETIIKEGEIQLTAEYRKQLREQKFNQIVTIIQRQAVDPKTHAPHPPQRIKNAMEEAKVKIDEFRSAKEQVQDIIDALRPVIPIRIEIQEIELKMDSESAVKAYPIVKKYGQILKEDWQDDGSWVSVIEIPGGVRDQLFNKLNKLTKGELESKIVSTR